MKIVELKEDIRDSSITEDINKINEIGQQLAIYTKFITDINITDYEYIKVLLNKSTTILSIVNYILENYFNEVYKKPLK